MNWTYDWLLDYLDTKETARGIADKLTGIGLEVENLSAPSEPVAAKIVECSDIPDTHLHLLKVDDGKDIRQVVCGAPNCRVGLVSALARPGCVVGGVEIKVGKIKGFESDGMMCSEKELGAGDDHGGIMELKNAKLGEPWNGEKASDANAVFDAKVLANRPDYLAVRGIARDLSATGIGKFIASRIPVIPAKAGTESRIPNPESRKIVIKNPERCPTYNFVEIRGIKIAPSCDKIASRLSAIGINPKNAPVDATNYVCFDIGQPMHCFDADEIKGDIIIRNAKDGEKFTDLFDAEHILSADDLVITDADGILALAGVMGGKRGMTTDKTENIILESAYFEPLGIRKTRRRLGLSTDSSYRFERGIDPTMTTQALALASEIIMKECGGKISAASCVRAEFTGPKIKYDPKFFKRRIGFDVDEKTQKEILEKLGYEITVDRELWTVSCPPWRVDDAIAEKLTSDIVRICGYDRIADMNISPSPKMVDIKPVCEENDFFAKTRRLVEHKSYGFGNLFKERLVSDKPNVKLANPLADYMNTARNSLVPNMLDAVAENEKRGYPDLAMFEVGTVFDGPDPGDEHKQIVIARAGAAEKRHWLKRERPVDIFDVKADLLAYVGKAETKTDNPPMWAHPYRYGRLVRDGKTLGEFGQLHPKLAKYWKIKTPVVLGVIDDISYIKNYCHPRGGGDRISHIAENNFQPITRDFSFALKGELPAEKIVAAAKSADPQIKSVTEFDFYENSVAFEITLEPARNLTDADLLEIQNKVTASVEKLGAKIRDK